MDTASGKFEEKEEEEEEEEVTADMVGWNGGGWAVQSDRTEP